MGFESALRPPIEPVRWAEVFETLEADAFAELARLAGDLSSAPIALVTLIDENRHWFTSVVGTPLAVGSWEETFCSHAVRQTAVFVVPDARCDPRFSDNSLVRLPPCIRFYAGAPLLAGGEVVGTLCVMDVKPRTLPLDTVTSLRALARQVVTGLELRRHARELTRFNTALTAEAEERRKTEVRLRDSERALRASEKALQQHDAERREFVANISHDLRTPLTALQGYIDTVLMKRETLDTATQREYLEQASAQARRLGCLVTDLFELAQLDDRYAAIRAERFDLADLLSDVIQSFQLTATGKGIALRATVPRRPTHVVGEVRLIERVLDNLLDNAIRFTPIGGHVTVTCLRAGRRLSVRVEDTGPGLAPSDRDQMFDRFFCGRQPAAGAPPTTGLGLSIARRIVELHGGTMTAGRSDVGGARVSFSLECADGAVVSPAT
ncbi:MAG: GAF domain-containing sensor histidine kinase [Vicinamibacterales bacterium]